MSDVRFIADLKPSGSYVRADVHTVGISSLPQFTQLHPATVLTAPHQVFPLLAASTRCQWRSVCKLLC